MPDIEAEDAAVESVCCVAAAQAAACAVTGGRCMQVSDCSEILKATIKQPWSAYSPAGSSLHIYRREALPRDSNYANTFKR